MEYSSEESLHLRTRHTPRSGIPGRRHTFRNTAYSIQPGTRHTPRSGIPGRQQTFRNTAYSIQPGTRRTARNMVQSGTRHTTRNKAYSQEHCIQPIKRHTTRNTAYSQGQDVQPRTWLYNQEHGIQPITRHTTNNMAYNQELTWSLSRPELIKATSKGSVLTTATSSLPLTDGFMCQSITIADHRFARLSVCRKTGNVSQYND